MPNGTVNWFNNNRGFGFITPEDGGADVFVHISDVEKSGLKGLNEGQKVSYELDPDRQGRMTAVNIQST
jgi:CspA family cold shock protein